MLETFSLIIGKALKTVCNSKNKTTCRKGGPSKLNTTPPTLQTQVKIKIKFKIKIKVKTKTSFTSEWKELK